MKFKTIFTAVALAVLLAGCSTVNTFLGSESGEAVMEHGGIIAGVFVGSNNLDQIDESVHSGVGEFSNGQINRIQRYRFDFLLAATG